MLESPETQRRIGRLAWATAWFGLVLGQLHAMARHNTADGKEDLQSALVRAWSDPGRRLFAPLLEWADPDAVYLTYGKLWLPVFVSLTLCALVVRHRRRPQGFERWAWRVAIVGYVYACVAVVLDYWTQLTDYNAFFEPAFLIGLPSIPIAMIGSTMLGISLLRRGFRPLATGWLLALAIPMTVLVSTVTSLGNVILTLAFAFGFAGRRIARDEPLHAGPTDGARVIDERAAGTAAQRL